MHEKLQDLYERWQVAGGEDKYFLSVKIHTLVFDTIAKRQLRPSPKLTKMLEKFGRGVENNKLEEAWMETFIHKIQEEANQ